MTYDAVRAMADAIDGGRASLGGELPDHDVVASQIGAGVVDFPGVSGQVALSSTVHVPEDKLVIVVEVEVLADRGRLRRTPLLACGGLTETEVLATWGPDGRNCPRDGP